MELPTHNKRVKELIEYFSEGNDSLFSRKLNISQQRITRLFHIESRNKKYPNVSLPIVEAILIAFPQVNAEWLILGKGNMLKEIKQDM